MREGEKGREEEDSILRIDYSFLPLYSEFNTAVDIRLHKWADSLSLGKLCAEVSPQ